MAILIVDDEANTREALRALLERLGHAPILEARHGQEALKLLLATPGRIRMVVADWEMPCLDGLGLVKEIATHEELDLTPYLLITSDLPRGALEEFRQTHPRLDHCLIKPFRMNALEEAMTQAAARRAASREALLLVSAGGGAAAQLLTCVAEKQAGHWREIVVAGTKAEVEAALSSRGRSIGAVLVAADALDAPDGGWLPEWLSKFRKTRQGGATPVVAASRNPLAIRPIRTQAQVFVDVSATAGASFWQELLAKLSRHLTNAWPLEHLSARTKELAQKDDFKAARKNLTTLFALDDLSSEVHQLAGEIAEGLGDRESAIRHYRRSNEINPCVPRSYIKLLGLETEAGRVAEIATQFCPENVDVWLAAAKVWNDACELGRAREALEQVLKLAPGHEGAAQLLKGLAR